MRSLTFLTSDVALTKSFNVDGTSEPYPLVSKFTSFEVAYNTIEDLKETLELVGSSGGCMLKGKLSTPIKNQSRVGLTSSADLTDLLVVDYDSDAGFDSITDLLTEIDPILADTDYVFQHSASSGIKGKSGIRGHVFIMLTDAVSPNILKQWLKKVNLTSQRFKDRIKLSRNAMALCYALDITVNQNDKLIYIAPPNCIGFDDPVSERFVLNRGAYKTFAFDSTISTESNRSKEHRLLAKLQDAAGLTKRTPKYKTVGDYEILTNPSGCIVSDTKDCGRFVRVNLNGGDSFAYWFAKDNPEILHNFKGEPSVYLRDIAPEFFEQLQQSSVAKTLRPFVFRDVAANIYYNAEYDEVSQCLGICYPSSRPALNDFMVQRGAPPPKTVPDWKVIFDPTTNSAVDFSSRIVNLFRPTRYLLNEDPFDATEHTFPIIERVIRHICVDAPTYEHFIQWVAHIVQFRTKTQTAWVFQGEEGTGKGTLFHRILTPILGHDHTFLITQDQADEQYNNYLRSNMLLFLDEGDMESSRAAERVLAKFRNLITDSPIPIRQMRANSVNMDNFTNLIIATNKMVPVRLTAGDRRYNIAPRQNEKLKITIDEYEQITKELHAFTCYLKSLELPTRKGESLKVLESEARRELQDLSKTVADNFFAALKSGNLDFFSEALLETVPPNNPGYITYARIINEWMKTAGEKSIVDMKDIIAVYQYLSGNENITDKRFGHLAARHQLESERLRISGLLRRVVRCEFKPADYNEWLNRNQRNNVITLKAPK